MGYEAGDHPSLAGRDGPAEALHVGAAILLKGSGWCLRDSEMRTD
jgi:hypothetical protein